MRSHTPNKRPLLNYTNNPHKKLLKSYSQEQMLSYIEDLESSLAINKQIINDLLSDLKDEKVKSSICLLIKENSRLQQKLKVLVLEKSVVQKRTLLVQDTILNNNTKEGVEKCNSEEMEKTLKKAKKLVECFNSDTTFEKKTVRVKARNNATSSSETTESSIEEVLNKKNTHSAERCKGDKANSNLMREASIEKVRTIQKTEKYLKTLINKRQASELIITDSITLI